MKEIDIISSSFEQHYNLTLETYKRHSKTIEAASLMILNSFAEGGKVFIFGNGGSAADSQHIAAEFVGRFLKERKSLPAIALTTDTSIITSLGNDYGFNKIFERQVEGLVSKQDIVIAISTSGESENVIAGAKMAKLKGASVIAFTGEEGGSLGKIADLLINVPSKETPRIQEMHTLIAHTICSLVENATLQDRGKIIINNCN